MRILDRYIGQAVVTGSLLALAVLLALFTFSAFVDNLSDVGRGNYGVVDVIEYLFLTLPRRAFELFPMAALLGSLLGLGALAGSSELTVVRAAGTSMGRVSLAVMKGGAILMLLAVILGEVVAPVTEEIAQNRRSRAISGKIALEAGQGLWARDGTSYINIRRMISEDEVADVYIYEFDAEHRLRVSTHAQSARYDGDLWMLEGVRQSELRDSGVIARDLARAEWKSVLAPDLITVAVVKPERLSIWGLAKYIRYLRENGQDSAPYELGLWGKIMAPLTTGVMIFLAIPFVFGPLRSVGVGQRVLVGSLVGISFYVLNQAFAKMGLVYGLSPFLSAVSPTVLFLASGLWMMRRTA